jgi:origin recognition complex subunit 4
LVEISKQLQLENVINDKVFGSFADSFEFLIRSFRSGGKQSKPLVFIMDEFDLFTKNKTQLLLYTVLNTIQISTSPMCLIGITCRIDVLDLLEKRIKSRFSHRQIYLFNDFDFTAYLEMAKYFILNYNLLLEMNINTKLMKYQNEYVQHLFDDPRLIKQFSRQFDYDKSIASLKRILLLPALKLTSMDKESLKQKDLQLLKTEITKAFDLFNIDSKLSLLLGLSILELTLVVVMLELSQLYPEQPFNFDLVYNSYLKFCQKRNWGQQKYEKQIILKV